MQKETVSKCLEQPLVAAEGEGRTSAAVALSQAWLIYLAAVQARQSSVDELKLVELAGKVGVCLFICNTFSPVCERHLKV